MNPHSRDQDRCRRHEATGPVGEFPLRAGKVRHISSVRACNLLDRLIHDLGNLLKREGFNVK